MKKFLSVLIAVLCAVIGFSVAACGDSGDGDHGAGTGGKTLVVYFSATGSTERVAGYVATAVNGDIFELVPVNPYSREDLNYNNENSRVSREHDDVNLRNVELTKTSADGWDTYETVFIGYPIWWGIAAWPVDGFIKNNDFSGKAVIPFCTSASFGLGQSDRLLAEAAGTGSWRDGKRFSSSASQTDVNSWVQGLGLDS